MSGKVCFIYPFGINTALAASAVKHPGLNTSHLLHTCVVVSALACTHISFCHLSLCLSLPRT